MKHLQVRLFVLNTTINVHKATHIRTNNVLRSGVGGIGYFLIAHGNAYRFKLYSKRATKAAAGFYIVHFPQFQTFYMA